MQNVKLLGDRRWRYTLQKIDPTYNISSWLILSERLGFIEDSLGPWPLP